MHDSIQPARRTRSRRAHLLAVALPLLLSGVLVAGCTGSSAGPATIAATGSPPSGAVSGCLVPPASCMSPHLFRVAYGIQPLLERGIDGRGETVTVLASPPPPGEAGSVSTCTNPPCPPATTDIRQDLKAFDSMFGLPTARIQVVTSLAGSASPWQATDQEVWQAEMVHVVAPAATLRVVHLPGNVLASAANATADMLAGLRLAVSGTNVASVGWNLGEHFFTKAEVAQLHSILRGAAGHHVTVVAGSGDNGGFSDAYGGTPVKEVSLPASSPLVLAAGGTVLTTNPSTGAYISEAAWNGDASVSVTGGASGGGFSHLYARPAYQDGIPGISTRRGVPDVAGDADGQADPPMVTADGRQTATGQAGPSTSAAAALWGGLVALADQYAHHGVGFVNPAIYRIARSPSYHSAFHDVTSGTSKLALPYPAGTAGYHAGPGWDPATGWGSPNAQVLIPLLARG
jgi:subtilase family serine protease